MSIKMPEEVALITDGLSDEELIDAYKLIKKYTKAKMYHNDTEHIKRSRHTFPYLLFRYKLEDATTMCSEGWFCGRDSDIERLTLKQFKAKYIITKPKYTN